MSCRGFKMVFGEYLSRLSDDELKRRVGEDVSSEIRNGKARGVEFCPPGRNDGYSLEELSDRDKSNFDEFNRRFIGK